MNSDRAGAASGVPTRQAKRKTKSVTQRRWGSTDKDDQATSYSYDDIYQLTHVDYPSGSDFGYEYDGVGNRTKMFEYTTSTITTTYTYDNADELTGYSGGGLTITMGYASDGCLTSKSDGSDAWTYVWDQERRLAAFKKNGDTLVEYGYNPTGTRRWASDSTLGLERYFHSGAHVLADYTSNWAIKRSYILGPSVDEIICTLDQGQDSVNPYYLMRDRLGSTRELVDANEQAVTRYAYDVWGARTETQLSGDISTQYRFTGREYDPTSGLYYYRARYYADALGRLTSRDPLYQMALVHVRNYVYVENNPATRTDPTGLVPGLTNPIWVSGQSREDCINGCNQMEAECEYNVNWVWQHYKVASYLAGIVSVPPMTLEGWGWAQLKSYLEKKGVGSLFDAARWTCNWLGDQCRRGCPDPDLVQGCPSNDLFCCDLSNYTDPLRHFCCGAGKTCVACRRACGNDIHPCENHGGMNHFGCNQWHLCEEGLAAFPYYGHRYYWVGPTHQDDYDSAWGQCH